MIPNSWVLNSAWPILYCKLRVEIWEWARGASWEWRSGNGANDNSLRGEKLVVEMALERGGRINKVHYCTIGNIQLSIQRFHSTHPVVRSNFPCGIHRAMSVTHLALPVCPSSACMRNIDHTTPLKIVPLPWSQTHGHLLHSLWLQVRVPQTDNAILRMRGK